MFDLPGTYAGLRIVASPHWPMERDGYETRRIQAHPDVRCLARWLARIGVKMNDFVEITVPRYRESDPAIDKIRGVIYCGVRTYQQMKAAVLPAHGAI